MAEEEEKQGLLRQVKENEQFLALNKPKYLPLKGPVTEATTATQRHPEGIWACIGDY
jgi:hypothetical protein